MSQDIGYHILSMRRQSGIFYSVKVYPVLLLAFGVELFHKLNNSCHFFICCQFSILAVFFYEVDMAANTTHK